MIIKSKDDKTKYFWIKIPRTATVAYSNFFMSELCGNIQNIAHAHHRYETKVFCDCNNTYTEYTNLPAVSVVRNPISRFISSLRFLYAFNETTNSTNKKIPVRMCPVCHSLSAIDSVEIFSDQKFIDFYRDETTFYEFLYDTFDKNCALKSGLVMGDAFSTMDSRFISSFFYTQIYWAYHPNVKIFKYEQLHEFNDWIVTTLQYDIRNLSHKNSSQSIKFPIDLTTDKFKQLVKHLFYDDFKYFNYDLPI
jgi:hypothetical protein